MIALVSSKNPNPNNQEQIINQKLSETIPAIIVSKNTTKTQSTDIKQTYSLIVAEIKTRHLRRL